ncbi:hypothetical protein KKH23_10235 [Patescibacteria group bacterium]|nr:hypothetical protein [Patescibacteria group bacterium]
MNCDFCGQSVTGLSRVSKYGTGIWACGTCYALIQKNYHKPYSKVMDKLAMVEAGYLLNRKLARARG